MVEGGASRPDDDRHELEVLPRGDGAAHGSEPVVGRVELASVLARPGPPVRAARVRDRPRLGRRVVERDPARDHLRWNEVVQVAAVLVHAERLRARRLPDAVVLVDPHSVPAHEVGGEAARPLGEHLGGDPGISLPAVADLPCAVLRVAPGHPVDLVRADARLVLAGEETVEALAQELDSALVDERLLDDEEAVALERRALLVGPLLAHRLGFCPIRA
jgi:hypothetical protein